MIDTLITQDQLLQLFQHIFGTNVKVVGQKVVNQDRQYLVLVIRLQRPSINVVLKLAGPDSIMAGSFDRTAMLHRLVSARTNIPVPETLAVNMSFRDWLWRYLVQVYVPGREWMSVYRHIEGQELSHAYWQIGNAVAQLHTVRFPTFGELLADGSVLNGKPFLAALADRAHLSIKNPHLCESFLSIVEKHHAVFSDVRQAVLCHEDLHGHNLIFQCHRGQFSLASILDFDKAWAGHQEIDLARMEFWRGMTAASFWEAYKEIHAIDPGYEARRPIYQLLWCFEFARSTPQHLADTQQLCRRYGFAVPVGFD